MANRTPRVLLVGPLPPPIGGTRVSFRLLVEFLSGRPEVDIRVLELRPVRQNPLRSLFSSIALMIRLVRETSRADLISLHCNPTALPVLGVALTLLAKLSRKPIMVRTFGGVPFLREYRGIRHALTYWVLKRADVYLAETKAQVTMALSHGIEKVRWFPNSRPMPVPHSPTNPRCTRFVFCSHVKPSKGILEIIEAAEQLNSDVVVDIYGTFHDGMTEEVFQGSQVVKYRGILDPDQVVPTLRQYDALLLPTYFEGEGYPGIIVDAYRAGLPVIATRWQAIPELLDESAGILVEPRSAPALRTAMRRLIDDSNLFRTLRAGAAKAAQRFSLDFWGPRFIELCAALPTHGPLPSDPDSTKRTA